jgi:integrase
MPKADPVNWTFKQASMYFLEDCETRNREPVKPSTLEAYRGHIKHIHETLGGRKVASFTVADMKEFVQILVDKKLKPKTIQTIVTTLKAIIAFPRDKHLNRLFKMDFDAKVIDMPRVKSRDQKAPTVSREVLEAAIASKDEVATLLIFLAASGLRISEALGTKIGAVADTVSRWNPELPLVQVRTQQGHNGDDASLKSDAAWRDVELPLDVHEYLKRHADLDNSRLFAQSESNYRKVITKRGVPGFHSLRRFYRTSLFDVPAGIMRHWMGHEDGSDISNRYDKLASDPRVRREWRDKINKGFRLPV